MALLEICEIVTSPSDFGIVGVSGQLDMRSNEEGRLDASHIQE